MQTLQGLTRRWMWRFAVRGIPRVDDNQGAQPFAEFVQRGRAMENPRILELGTKRVVPTRSTRHDSWFPNAGEYLGTDIEKDVDVDIVADVHRLSMVTGIEQFDIVLTEAGFEHFKYPHLAAHEIMKVLKMGGVLFIQSHQTFPIHAVPSDYFRFSREALAGLFGSRMGFHVVSTGYASPARIFSRVDPEGFRAPAFLHVQLFGEKTAPTPDEYVFEYDCLTE